MCIYSFYQFFSLRLVLRKKKRNSNFLEKNGKLLIIISYEHIVFFINILYTLKLYFKYFLKHIIRTMEKKNLLLKSNKFFSNFFRSPNVKNCFHYDFFFGRFQLLLKWRKKKKKYNISKLKRKKTLALLKDINNNRININFYLGNIRYLIERKIRIKAFLKTLTKNSQRRRILTVLRLKQLKRALKKKKNTKSNKTLLKKNQEKKDRKRQKKYLKREEKRLKKIRLKKLLKRKKQTKNRIKKEELESSQPIKVTLKENLIKV